MIGTLGMLSFGFGTYIVAIVVAEVFTEGITAFELENAVAIGFYIGPGISWITGAIALEEEARVRHTVGSVGTRDPSSFATVGKAV